MHAYVYKSQRKAETYVYLAARDAFDRLPEPLRTQLGPLEFVLDVALTPGRRLAREDAGDVRANLAARGFHLQFPPGRVADPMHEDWGTDA
ncbi:YcgL domain-containing protein [Luteimonas kalidii]|uniref:YcgL domain-containing protein QFW81_14800 n=1 Tax=Luteimonas kalidii TaxID=3042025 RepID=A0ABT6JXI1_9GAMM|nr:YcgL domain-containing protein [Luteimonas kalidii]MDH5835182.1 YcgL domain-containing protein [Luteimonas kalidii]